MRGTALLACGLGLSLVVLAQGCAKPQAEREALVAAQLAGEPPREQLLDARELIARTRNRPFGAVLAIHLGKSLCGRVIGQDPANGLHVLDLGARDGLREGDLLLLFQYDRFLGKALVEQVFPERASLRTNAMPPGTVGPPPPPPVALPEDRTRGKVIQVDHKTGILVLDLAQPQGVKKGEEVVIARGNNFIASATIFDVQIDKSGARLGPMVKEMPAIGDVVLRKRESR